MLSCIHIENYALIRQTDIVFAGGYDNAGHLQPAMTAITGETGAGKSIMLGALALLRGQRADSGVLLDKERKCVAEATFDVRGLDLQPFFADNDLDYDDTLILRREILPSAKSRAFVNDTPVSLPILKEIGSRLLDIHSQHETLTLANSDFQTNLLDSFNNTRSVRNRYTQVFSVYQNHKRRLEELTAAEAESRKEQDYMQYLFGELQEAQLSEGEQEELEQESQLLANAEGIKQALTTVRALCDDDGESEDSAVSRLSASKAQLSRIASCHPEVAALSQRLESNLIDLRDILSEMTDFDEKIQFSPERQQEVDQRLDLIYRLEKKHNVDSVGQLLQIFAQLDQRLQTIAGADEEIRKAMEAVDKSFAQVQTFGEQLTELRLRSAAQVEQQVLPLLSALGMNEARLQVCVETIQDYNAMGCNKVRFLFNANRGGEMREMSKVISGGELSRLMLALKSLTARESLLPTLIFDEIDTGISGQVSSQMAHILSDMSQTLQVIVITHLPQMAAVAAQHLKVYKETEETATVSRIRELSQEERVREIAVMLSTNPPTAAALQTARELMESC